MDDAVSRPVLPAVTRWRSWIWAASLVLVLVLTTAAVATITEERRTTLAAATRTTQHLTQLLGVVVDQMIRDVDGLAAGLQMALTVIPRQDGTIHADTWRWLADGMKERPAVRSYYLIDRDGRIERADMPALVGQDMTGRRHFKAHETSAVAPAMPPASDPFVSPTTRHRQLLVSWPLHDATGNFAGVLAVGFDTRVIKSRLGSLADSEHDIVALIMDDRVILAAAGIGAIEDADPLQGDQGLATILSDIRQTGHTEAITRTTTLFGNRASWMVDVQPLAMLDGSIILARNIDGVLERWRWHALAFGGGTALLVLGILASTAAVTGLLERQRRALAAATADALTDPLTRLFNRRMLEERARIELAQARTTRQSMALMVMDIDHFKRINDRFGHAAGDAVLVAVGRHLTSLVRRDDLLARIGGEEFAILLPNIPLAAAERQAERLRQAVEDLRIDIGTQVLAVTMSIGIAEVPIDAPSLDAAFDAADAALYAAKSAGRNRTVMAEPITSPDRLTA